MSCSSSFAASSSSPPYSAALPPISSTQKEMKQNNENDDEVYEKTSLYPTAAHGIQIRKSYAWCFRFRAWFQSICFYRVYRCNDNTFSTPVLEQMANLPSLRMEHEPIYRVLTRHMSRGERQHFSYWVMIFHRLWFESFQQFQPLLILRTNSSHCLVLEPKSKTMECECCINPCVTYCPRCHLAGWCGLHCTMAAQRSHASVCFALAEPFRKLPMEHVLTLLSSTPSLSQPASRSLSSTPTPSLSASSSPTLYSSRLV